MGGGSGGRGPERMDSVMLENRDHRAVDSQKNVFVFVVVVVVVVVAVVAVVVVIVVVVCVPICSILPRDCARDRDWGSRIERRGPRNRDRGSRSIFTFSNFRLFFCREICQRSRMIEQWRSNVDLFSPFFSVLFCFKSRYIEDRYLDRQTKKSSTSFSPLPARPPQVTPCHTTNDKPKRFCACIPC